MYFGLIGRAPEIAASLGSQFDVWIEKNRCKTSMPGFHFESQNDSDYYPFSSIEYDSVSKRWFYIDGHLWHEQCKTNDQLRDKIVSYVENLFENKDINLPDGFYGTFNLIAFDETTSRLIVANDSGAMFPFYYAIGKNWMAFSGNVHILAKAISASLDDIGIIQSLTLSYNLGRTTLYREIKLMQPGEVLSFDPIGNVLDIKVSIEPYQEVDYSLTTEYCVDKCWELFTDACVKLGRGQKYPGLLLSGGLDSRMIIAAFHASSSRMITVTHGQVGYGESRIARQVADSAGSTNELVDMDSESFTGTPDDLESLIWRINNPVFPVWRLSGVRLKQAGAQMAITGYALDATLGGHFHDAQNQRERLRQRLVYATIGPTYGMRANLSADAYLNAFITKFSNMMKKRINYKKIILTDEYHNHLLASLGLAQESIREEVERVKATGTTNPAKVIERYLMENHARKYTFTQELTARLFLPVIVPAYERKFINFLSTVPSEFIANHYLYYKIIRKHARKFAKIQGSANLMPITYPTVLLEIGRLVRNRIEAKMHRVYLESKGTRIIGKRFAGCDLEVASRRNGVLDTMRSVLARDYKSNILDSTKINKWIDEAENHERRIFGLLELTPMLAVHLAGNLTSV